MNWNESAIFDGRCVRPRERPICFVLHYHDCHCRRTGYVKFSHCHPSLPIPLHNGLKSTHRSDLHRFPLCRPHPLRHPANKTSVGAPPCHQCYLGRTSLHHTQRRPLLDNGKAQGRFTPSLAHVPGEGGSTRGRTRAESILGSHQRRSVHGARLWQIFQSTMGI